MTIKYKTTQTLRAEEFINILERSTLGERRPIDDAAEYYPKVGFAQHPSAWILAK